MEAKMTTLKKKIINPAAVRIRKRLIWIRAVRALLKEIANSFTHKISKRRDLVTFMEEILNRLEREIRRDIRKDDK